MKEITAHQIIKLERSNDKNYDRAISDALFTLRNSFYDVLIESFEYNAQTFVVKDFGFNERLTKLCGFDWFNTISYLNLMGVDNNVCEYIRHLLLNESKEFNYIFENATTSLLDSKQKVIKTEELEKIINDYFVKIYNSFIEKLIKQVMNNFIPSVVRLAQQLLDSEIDQDLLTKKLRELNYKTVKVVSNELTSDLKKNLNEIYATYGLNTKTNQKTSESKKIPFSDFDKSKTLFKAGANDEEIALETLGLNKSATWEQIRKAYKELAMKYHPDRNKSKYATDQMEKINSAYNLLKNKINN